MNTLSLVRLKQYGVLAQIIGTEGGRPHLRINLPSGRATGIAAPPFPFESSKWSAATAHISDVEKRELEEKDESCAIAARVLLVLARHGAKVAAANKDGNISPPGRHAISIEATTAGLSAIGGHYAGLERIRADLERQHQTLYAVPAADAPTAIVDVEVRTLFRAMPLPERKRALSTAAKPESQRFLFAIKRSPLPLDAEDAQLLEEAWVKRVSEAKPEAVATLQIAQENNAWALRSTKDIAAVIANPSLNGTGGTIDRLAAYRILKPTGGAAVLEFSDEEVRHFERIIAKAAA